MRDMSALNQLRRDLELVRDSINNTKLDKAFKSPMQELLALQESVIQYLVTFQEDEMGPLQDAVGELIEGVDQEVGERPARDQRPADQLRVVRDQRVRDHQVWLARDVDPVRQLVVVRVAVVGEATVLDQ